MTNTPKIELSYFNARDNVRVVVGYFDSFAAIDRKVASLGIADMDIKIRAR